MKEFIYKAYSDDGSIIEDSLQAESRREAAQEIFARELHLIHLEEKKAPSSISFFRKPFSSRRKLALLQRSGRLCWMRGSPSPTPWPFWKSRWIRGRAM